MASSSSSSIPNTFKYDVFLSFRGEDTRKTFVGHLYKALKQKGIVTYMDDEKIEQGERISNQLIKSIEDSKFSVIIFSKNYASSSWCLDELVKIMECQKMTDHTAFPVFYEVEPTQVRNQSGAVKEAFAQHENKEAAGKWRDAMKELADLAGWVLKATANGDESKTIQIIVDVIFEKKYFTLSNVDETLVGMETRVGDVLSSLEFGAEDVRMIGIKGMGGAGKTTLATAVYDRISTMFEGKSFVENVREVSTPTLSGLKKLQKRILKDMLQDISFSSVHDGKHMLKDMMSCRKMLLVLDDVDCIEQLEALAGKSTWFKSGSRIIVTTRDEQVLVAHGVNFIHDVSLLSSTEAICLFNRYAFKEEIPTPGYEELSEQVVRYAHGLPLTIKVLGSFLCGQSEVFWVDAIERLKTIPLEATMKRLEISFDGLEKDHQGKSFVENTDILKTILKMNPPSTMGRWSLEEEIAKLTAEVLKRSFPYIKDEEPMTIRCKEKFGDYQCENVLSIWPKLRERGSLIQPVSVGKKIKKYLRERDMIQGEPRVRDIGFVTFKLSNIWISKSIHQMLRHGLHMWAPKLPVERVIIHYPSRGSEEFDEEFIDDLERTIIGGTLSRMLEYSKVVVSFSGLGNDSEPCKAQEDELNSCFVTRDGDAVIYGKAEGELKPLIRVKREEDFSNAFKDLGAFWTGLVNKNADWIICLTPAWRHEYIKMCFNAAEHARWINTDRYYGLSYAGYRTRAKSWSSSGELGGASQGLEYTNASFLESARKYTYLKNNRLAEFTFTTDEMLCAEGNTFVYLVITHARVRKITSDSSKDIEKLKKASKLTLENVEAWEKGKGHALGLHLLGFTEVLKQACLSFLPHILCEFLYELSEKFNNYNSSYTFVREVESVAKTSRLLLCEATLVVMEQCFHLLGITLAFSGKIRRTILEDEARFLEYISYLRRRFPLNEQKDLVITPISVHRDPPRNSRFELIAVCPESSNRFEKGKIFGYIIVSDEYGVRLDGWEPIYKPDCGYVSLLNYDWCDAENMINHGHVYPPNPSSHRTVPLSPAFSIRMELFVKTEEKDSFFQLGYKGRELDFSEFEGKNAADGACGVLVIEGKDLVAHLYYVLLKDAVDTCLEVTFNRDTAPDAAPDADALKVYGEMKAFYGNDFPYSSDYIVKGFYKASLFEPDVNFGLWAGPIKLRKSALAAPRNGSLVIQADLRDVDSGKLIMDSHISFTFEEAINCILGEGCSGVKVGRILGEGCYFEVKVNWKYNKA